MWAFLYLIVGQFFREWNKCKYCPKHEFSVGASTHNIDMAKKLGQVTKKIG